MKNKKPLGLFELIAIAVGGMIGGGIFSILGVAAEKMGGYAPLAIGAGGIMAFFAAYSYVKLALYYMDEGATYSFFKRTFPDSSFAASAIGWFVVFGYISTLALYAFTFSTYVSSFLANGNSHWVRVAVAALVLLSFVCINLWSTEGMGKIEDLLVYVKLILLGLISLALFTHGSISQYKASLPSTIHLGTLLTTAAITFVAYEGFQLVIHAINEMEMPEKNVPRAIYSAGFFVSAIYIILAVSAFFCIPVNTLINDKEYALAGGAQAVLGSTGYYLVILGAVLATTSAINGTLFGASRLIAVIAQDGYLPEFLSRRRQGFIPYNAVVIMGLCAFALIVFSQLDIILEFGSLTFLIVSFLMAYANYVKRLETKTHVSMAIIAMLGLAGSTIAILWHQWSVAPETLGFTFGIYAVLSVGSWFYSMRHP